eukprot:364535-Chlamydomonas_euryale.AAC.2
MPGVHSSKDVAHQPGRTGLAKLADACFTKQWTMGCDAVARRSSWRNLQAWGRPGRCSFDPGRRQGRCKDAVLRDVEGDQDCLLLWAKRA